MNKFFAIVKFIVGTLAFLVNTVSILLKAVYESHFYAFDFFVELVIFEWKNSSRIKFKEVVEDTKELWNKV